MKLLARLRPRLSYANLISTVCLFLLLGGGAAFAATQLPKNSVGAKQLKKHAVTPAKLAKSTLSKLQGGKGPAGPAGAVGPAGAKGAAGADAGPVYAATLDGPGLEFPLGEDTDVDAPALKNLAAGSYLVNFTASLFSTSKEAFLLFCGVEPEAVETTQGGDGVALTAVAAGDGNKPQAASFAAQTVVTFPTAGGELVAGCDSSGGEVKENKSPSTPFATDLILVEPQLTALKVPSASIEEVEGGPVLKSGASTLGALGLSH